MIIDMLDINMLQILHTIRNSQEKPNNDKLFTNKQENIAQ